MAKIIALIVEVLIFTALIGIIASGLADGNSTHGLQANLSGASVVLVGLITLVIMIGFFVGILKTAGVNSR